METATVLRAGAARLSLEPPLSLPMVGFLRQAHVADGYGWPLETSAIALEHEGARCVLCGVDIVGIGEPEISALIRRVSEVVGVAEAAILLNWSHTHLAPTGGFWGAEAFGPPDEDRDRTMTEFANLIQAKVVSVCALAMRRLEPVLPVWAVGEVELAVNRRERAPDGRTILGWNPDALIDNQVTALQFRRPDDSAVATLVSFGCHPVTTGFDMSVYSADYPGPLRDVVRRVTGGECVFFQGAGGNALPKVAFTADECEAERMGTRIGLEALRALSGRASAPERIVRVEERSLMPISTYRRERIDTPAPELAGVSENVRFPLLPHPSIDEVRAVREEWEGRVETALAAGDIGSAKVAWYHAGWAIHTERSLLDGTAPTFREGRIHALRIGDGVIATGPGETFTEIGMAVKERAPGRPTLYCGYTNGLVAYFPTAAEYSYGGFEAGIAHRSSGNPSHVSPDCERILVQTAVRCAERLFPDANPWPAEGGWVATGALPVPLPADDPLPHPSVAPLGT